MFFATMGYVGASLQRFAASPLAMSLLGLDANSLSLVLGEMDVPTLLKLTQVCKALKAASTNDVWRTVVRRQYPALVKLPHATDYRRICQQMTTRTWKSASQGARKWREKMVGSF